MRATSLARIPRTMTKVYEFNRFVVSGIVLNVLGLLFVVGVFALV